MAVGAVAVGAVAVEVWVAFLPTSSRCRRSEDREPLSPQGLWLCLQFAPAEANCKLLVATHLCTETAAVQHGDKEAGAHLWIVRNTGQ